MVANGYLFLVLDGCSGTDGGDDLVIHLQHITSIAHPTVASHRTAASLKISKLEKLGSTRKHSSITTQPALASHLHCPCFVLYMLL